MIPYAAYKIVHYIGIFFLVTALVASLARAAGGLRGPDGKDPWAKKLMATHGIALFLILLGGFGMLARIGFEHGALFPGWIWVKLGVWAALGGMVAVARRSEALSGKVLIWVPILAVLAGAMAFTKPF